MYPGYFSDLWDAMQWTARDLPRGILSQEQRDNFRQYIEGQCAIVPCPTCEDHALKYLLTHPLDPPTGQQAFEWVIDFHNSVNARNNKRLFTYQEAEAMMMERVVGKYKDVPQSQVIQLECKDAIAILEQKIKEVQVQPEADSKVVTNQTMFPYVVVTMVIAIIMLLFLIGLFCLGGNIAAGVRQIFTACR